MKDASQARRPSDIFNDAAAALASGSTMSPEPGIAHALGLVGAIPGHPLPENPGHAVRMLRFASRLDRIFQLSSPFAPGAFFFGALDSGAGSRPPGNYAGRGLTPQAAFASCVGEAAEYSAMHLQTRDTRLTAEGDGLKGKELLTGASVHRPVGQILRHPDGTGPTSTGYAAGPTHAAAQAGAILECIERDAIARWEGGETQAMALPEPWQPLEAMAAAGRTAHRDVFFADISPRHALAPTVVAVSSDTVGLGTAFGFGAGFTPGEAAAKAFLELCQGEIGLLILSRKRATTPSALLTVKEEEALARSQHYRPDNGILDFRTHASLQNGAGSDRFSGVTLDQIVLENRIETFDLSVSGEDIPVVRAFVEGLEDAAKMSHRRNPPLL